MSANAYRECTGLRRARSAYSPADATAPAVGRVVQLPDGGRAVLVCQDTAADSWHAQRTDGPDAGALLTLTGWRARHGRRAFPVVGNHLDADAYPAPTLPGLDTDELDPRDTVTPSGQTVAELLAWLGHADTAAAS